MGIHFVGHAITASKFDAMSAEIYLGNGSLLIARTLIKNIVILQYTSHGLVGGWDVPSIIVEFFGIGFKHHQD